MPENRGFGQSLGVSILSRKFSKKEVFINCYFYSSELLNGENT